MIKNLIKDKKGNEEEVSAPAPSNLHKAAQWPWEESLQEREERWECYLEFVGPGRKSSFSDAVISFGVMKQR